jgi:hypothetical protein
VDGLKTDGALRTWRRYCGRVEVGEQFRQQISPAAAVPQMMMCIDNRQFGFEDRLLLLFCADRHTSRRLLDPAAELVRNRLTGGRWIRTISSAKSSVILRAAAIASGALLLAYDTPEGKIIYPGRVGTGMPVVELERQWRRPQSLVIEELPLRPHRCPTAATTSASAMRSCSIAGLKGQADRCETTSDIVLYTSDWAG